jgi:tetratricopeptide (TPR) repeat protein
MSVALLLIASIADPCGAIDLAEPSPELADIYLEVAEGERAAGAEATALEAYRRALSYRPSDPRARAAIAEICGGREQKQRAARAAREKEQRIDRAARAIEENRAEEAMAQLEGLAEEPAIALLRAIAHYELGEDDRSVQLLERARTSTVTSETAAMYLALIALRSGESQRSAELLERVAAEDEETARAIAMLKRQANRSGRLILSALAEVGWDGNVTLSDAGIVPSGASDGVVLGLLHAELRPLGYGGPFVSLLGRAQEYFLGEAFDLLGAGGSAGWRLGDPGQELALSYRYDYATLDLSPYLSAHALRAAGRWSFGQVALGGGYRFGVNGYFPEELRGFSGFEHTASIDLGWRFVEAALISLEYGFGRDQAESPDLRSIRHGPNLALRFALGPARLGIGAAFSSRDFDRASEGFGAPRRDRYLDGSIDIEIDALDELIVLASIRGRRAFSNLDPFDYTKITAGVGLSWIDAFF